MCAIEYLTCVPDLHRQSHCTSAMVENAGRRVAGMVILVLNKRMEPTL